jgi:hypothetical protein
VRCHNASAEARLVVDAVLDAAEQGRPLKGGIAALMLVVLGALTDAARGGAGRRR